MNQLPRLLSATFMLLGVLLLAASPARADEAKPAKPPAAAAKPAAPKEVTLTGTLGCAKCSFKESNACQNVLKVKESGKEVSYLVEKNSVIDAQHQELCGSERKSATVKGTVSEAGGKKVLNPSEVKFK